MPLTKVVVTVQVLDSADILREYLEWYVSLDVDLILANDFGSTDGSQDILEEFARRNLVQWSLHPDKHAKDYDPTAQLARVARDRYGANWVIQCDIDEFLCADGDRLRTLLDRAARDDVTVLSTRGANMTGPPVAPGQSAPRTLTLRIERGFHVTPEQQVSGDLPLPAIFLQKPPKTIVWAAAFAEYGPGNHTAASRWGGTGDAPQLRFLHYPMRGFDALRTKVRHAEEWFEANPHLLADPSWGWHWRRLIRLNEAGRLRAEWDRQFTSPDRARELLADGTCVVDETVANGLQGRH